MWIDGCSQPIKEWILLWVNFLIRSCLKKHNKKTDIV